MSAGRVAFLGGLLALAIALGVVLSGSPLESVASNHVPAEQLEKYIEAKAGDCQASATIPRGTSAIRVSLAANVGPAVSVRVIEGSRTIARGARRGGWGESETVTVPIGSLPHAVQGALVCTTIAPAVEFLRVDGVPAKRGRANIAGVSLRLEYLRPGPRSWLSLAPSISRDLGLGHAFPGTGIVFLLLALMLGVIVLASQPARRGALTCALVAFLSAACWSLITPPFQSPDEPSHFAYTQELVETGSLPTPALTPSSPAEEQALTDLHLKHVRSRTQVHPILDEEEERRLQLDLSRPLGQIGYGGAGVAGNQPPLYYAIEAIPYTLGGAGNLLDQVELMRLLSALTGGLTALFTFMFLREALPAVPWAWSVGALSVAAMPLLGFMSGVVNPDALLFAVSAALFYCLARAFRRGFTLRMAVAIGMLTALGFLTKLNFVGLAPGVILGVILLAVRSTRSLGRRAALRSLVVALAIGLGPGCVYLIVNLLTDKPGLGALSSGIDFTSGRGSLFKELSYIWQFYLPSLPGMASSHFHLFVTRDIWFDRWTGLYGWLDTVFPVWVENFALIPAVAILALFVRGLLLSRAALRARLGELSVYVAMAIGLLGLVGADSYLSLGNEGAGYFEPRYMLPLAPLFAAVLALAARGAGRRAGPAVGGLIVVLFVGHDIFSQLLTVARFYG